MKQEVQGSIPTLGMTFFALFYMDAKEIEVIIIGLLVMALSFDAGL